MTVETMASENDYYAEFTTRNIGFVSASEQERLRSARVLLIGSGGMGGAALQALSRAGIGHFAIADIDTFEVSNFNRQVFADLDTVNCDKAQATAARVKRINPYVQLEIFGREWPNRLDELLKRYPIVINGMDDIRAGINLYRRARSLGASIVDAYTSSLPSVAVVRPGDPLPEERLQYPSRGRTVDSFDEALIRACFVREMEYVLVHSSTAHHIDLGVAADLIAGKRKRMSFAPMVITTGNLMAFEAIKHVLGRGPGAGYRGYFFNPWRMRVERPLPWFIAAPKRLLVRRFIERMLHDQ